MGEKCPDSLPEKSIKKYSPSDQLLLHLSSAAHNFLIAFENFPTIH